MALRIRSNLFGVGGAISAFEGSAQYRLVFATTPVDDAHSDMFYSIWWPKAPDDGSVAPPESLRERVEREFLVTLWDDLEIWRYQKYVEHPALAQQDVRPYGSLRKWAKNSPSVPSKPTSALISSIPARMRATSLSPIAWISSGVRPVVV